MTFFFVKLDPNDSDDLNSKYLHYVLIDIFYLLNWV